MRLYVQQTECAGKMFWIVRDTDHYHSWFYYGPLPDGLARAFVQQKKAAWKALLRTERAKRKATLAA
jgi:hypothetical protein